jgi:hypothetical protein
MISLMPTTLSVFVSEVNHPDAKRSAVFNVSPPTPLFSSRRKAIVEAATAKQKKNEARRVGGSETAILALVSHAYPCLQRRVQPRIVVP